MEKPHGNDKKDDCDDMIQPAHIKTLGIFTKNFCLFHDLVSTLKSRNISYVSLTSMEHIPNGIGVVLTSHSELHDFSISKVIAADAYGNIDIAIDKALHLLIGKELYAKTFIGIDPGEKPGIAVVGDDILLQKTQIKSPENVIRIVKQFIKNYPSKEYHIRIGHGSILNRNRIINSLIPLGISIEIVDESKTSSSQQTKRTTRDSEAAAAIALMKGSIVQRRLPLQPTRGDVKHIQEKSRQLTEGRFSISEMSALDVLKGKKSLAESIRDETAKRTKGTKVRVTKNC
jgi:hypothetical protein